MKADKDFEPMPQRLAMPASLLIPLWLLTVGVWINALWTHGLTATIRDYLLR
jgi:hypothetical protein